MNTFLGFVIIALFVWWMVAIVVKLSAIARNTEAIAIHTSSSHVYVPDHSEVLAEIKKHST